VSSSDPPAVVYAYAAVVACTPPSPNSFGSRIGMLLRGREIHPSVRVAKRLIFDVRASIVFCGAVIAAMAAAWTSRTRLTTLIYLISVRLIAKIQQQLFNAPRDRAVTFNLPRPSSLTRIVRKRQLKTAAFPQPRCIGRRRHEARATEVKIALTGAGQSHFKIER
jgi:hypothetical protein